MNKSPGKLRVYLGIAPGVGKTYAMLEEGLRRVIRGTDVIVGFVETHGREKILELTKQLEVIPRLKANYHNHIIEDIDLDAIIKRKPDVVLIDELAHSNLINKTKRWQDVINVLSHGIHVITTINIQHLESINVILKNKICIQQKELVPDHILLNMCDVQLIDMTPVALRKRIRHGNVYPEYKIQQALNNFFTESNIKILRYYAFRWMSTQYFNTKKKYAQYNIALILTHPTTYIQAIEYIHRFLINIINYKLTVIVFDDIDYSTKQYINQLGGDIVSLNEIDTLDNDLNQYLKSIYVDTVFIPFITTKYYYKYNKNNYRLLKSLYSNSQFAIHTIPISNIKIQKNKNLFILMLQRFIAKNKISYLMQFFAILCFILCGYMLIRIQNYIIDIFIISIATILIYFIYKKRDNNQSRYNINSNNYLNNLFKYITYLYTHNDINDRLHYICKEYYINNINILIKNNNKDYVNNQSIYYNYNKDIYSLYLTTNNVVDKPKMQIVVQEYLILTDSIISSDKIFYIKLYVYILLIFNKYKSHD